MLGKNLGDRIKDVLTDCLESLRKEYPSIGLNSVQLEIPKEKSHGDLATNLAFKLAGHLKQNPNDIAQRLARMIEPMIAKRNLTCLIEKVEVKAPGFVNFWFGKEYLHGVLDEIEKNGKRYGASNLGMGKKIQIEFVSANPTGPLTVAHGRQAAVGDSLANILGYANYKVKKEYYINDEGNQIALLGESIKSRYLEALGQTLSFPENGYQGKYIIDIANEIKDKYGSKREKSPVSYFSDLGVRAILKTIKDDLKEFGVTFDVWFSQKAFTKKGKIEKTLKILKKKGYIYEKDGAVWFKSNSLGDDKDRVVVKSDGSFTYLAPDVAYHEDKFKRGFKRIINIWGPDHHGYIARLKAAVKALGHSEEDVVVLLVQLATLYRGGEVIPMSTRGGRFITLREVMEEAGRDAARFFFLMRKTDSHLDFDLELAKKTSFDNPVYYIQYGHARSVNISGFAKEKYPGYSSNGEASLLTASEELAVLKLLRKFPYVITASAQHLEPYFLITYLTELAGAFHRFYTKHRVVTEDMPLSCARLRLASCTKAIFAQGLTLLGVSAPAKM